MQRRIDEQQRRELESSEERDARLQQEASRQRERRAPEASEEREARLQQMASRQRERRSSGGTEESLLSSVSSTTP